MTRKHYEKIALMLAEIDDRATRAKMIAEFICIAVDDNPRFDAIRFADAVAKHYEARA